MEFKLKSLFNNIKFVRKIQGGFTFLALISTIILAVSYLQLSKMGKIKDEIFNGYVNPEEQINNVYSNFQRTQFIMMQFSMPAFANKFNKNAKEYNVLKGYIDSSVDSLIKTNLNEDIKKQIVGVKAIWNDYKNLVADAILSASASQNYDMAADIATTSGEEVGIKLQRKFDNVQKQLVLKAEQLDEQIRNSVNTSLMFTIAGALAGSIVFLICVFLLAPAITKPLNKLKEIVKEFALGNYELKIIQKSKDEIGELTESLRTLQKAQKDKIFAAEQIASGVISKVTPTSKKDALSIAFNKEVDTIEALLHETGNLINANKNGDMSLRSKSTNFDGEWGKLLEGINSILDAVSAPINESANVLKIMANGDFTTRVAGNYKGDHQLMKNNINTVSSSLSDALRKVGEAVLATASAANEISASVEEMAAGAGEQTQQVSEIAHSVEQMTQTILDNTKNATIAAESAKGSGDKAKLGGEVVEDTIKGMERIAEVVKESAETVETLGKSSDAIGEIIQVIDDIADQTNLLALNAAIEAARAGEKGRGFAVVADEVRKLAERTTKATKEIADMIKKIQKDTSDAVQSMNQGREEVDKGKALANKAGEALNEIITNAQKVSDVVALVAAASEEQSATAEEISRNIESISSVTQQSASGTQQIAHATEDLSGLTQNLEKLVGHFKVDNVENIEETSHAFVAEYENN